MRSLGLGPSLSARLSLPGDVGMLTEPDEMTD